MFKQLNGKIDFDYYRGMDILSPQEHNFVSQDGNSYIKALLGTVDLFNIRLNEFREACFDKFSLSKHSSKDVIYERLVVRNRISDLETLYSKLDSISDYTMTSIIFDKKKIRESEINFLLNS